MPDIHRRSVTIPAKRQRKEFTPTELRALRDSIETKQLLHAPVFMELSSTTADGEPSTIYQLVAGERRLRAIDAIFADGGSFRFEGRVYSDGTLPATVIPLISLIERKELELAENIDRVDLTWQERTQALADLHSLRTAENPGQTLKATAEEVVARQQLPESAVKSVAREIREASVIAENIHRPEIAAARNEHEAFQLILAREEAFYGAELRKRRIVAADAALKCEIRHASMLETLPTMDSEIFDLILTDPPYGINAGSDGYRARTKLHHNYDDTEDYARELLMCILREGWRVCKKGANLFIFTDIKHFDWLCNAAARMGWSPWRRPVIWQKSQSEGLAPWKRQGFAYTYDVIFFATKGQRGLNMRVPDILFFPRVSRNNRIYAAEKPVGLLRRLIEISTLPGDYVLDPCAGSGSTLIAAKEVKRHVLGFEIDQNAVDLTNVRLFQGDAHADFSAVYGDETEDPDSGSIEPSQPLAIALADLLGGTAGTLGTDTRGDSSTDAEPSSV